MRKTSIGVTTVLVILLAASAQAQNLGALEGFGGLSFSASQSITPNVGGTLSIAPIPYLQIIGEAGRLGNVLPTVADEIFHVTGADVQASAFYADGGLRFMAAPHSHVSPYAEATAGMARLSVSATGLGRIGNTVLPAATALLPHSGPVVGGGGGLMMHAGALQIDLGYRFKQLYPPALLGAALGLGQPLRSQQVRLGLGVRF